MFAYGATRNRLEPAGRVHELIVERRVNAVAQALGIVQLAVSNALARLR
jgi:hypothetical protein